MYLKSHLDKISTFISPQVCWNCGATQAFSLIENVCICVSWEKTGTKQCLTSRICCCCCCCCLLPLPCLSLPQVLQAIKMRAAAAGPHLVNHEPAMEQPPQITATLREYQMVRCAQDCMVLRDLTWRKLVC